MEILYLSSSSVCFETGGKNPYFSGEEYTVYVDGEEAFKGNTNVFSLFSLNSDTDYTVEVCFEEGRKETVTFHTGRDACVLNVKDLGAKGDGITDDTAVLQAAVNILPEGGKLFFPEGTYITFPLVLKSRIVLELSAKATIRFSPDRERYPILPGIVKDQKTGEEISLVAFEGLEQDCYRPLLYACMMKDISIIGQGHIDGNGKNGDWWGDFQSFPAARPRLFFANRCQGITLHGVTFENSPAWHIHPFFTENFAMLDCTVQAPKVSPNTDAVDPESCTGVKIIGCRFSVGDDCIAVKSGKLELAQKYHTPARDHVIRNCLMEYGHGSLTIGSEASAGVKNMTVTQCFFKATDRGLRIKSRRGRGRQSDITDVVFDNIRMEKVLTPVVINMWYSCVDPDGMSDYVSSREALPVDERTPHLGSFAFRNMECIDAEAAACYIDGLPESPIDEVMFENVRITFADNAVKHVAIMQKEEIETCRLGLYFDNVRRVIVKNVKLEGVEGEKLIVNHGEEIIKENFEE